MTLYYSYSGKLAITYFFVVSTAFLVVSTLRLSVFALESVVAGGIELIAALSTFVESVVDDVLPLLLQATNTPAIAKIPRNFFMRF